MIDKATVAAIILAAGASSRMGRPKQLLAVGEQSLIQKAVDTALQAQCYPIVVLGANAGLVQSEILGKPTTTIVNEQWQEGMGTSIRTGALELVQVLPEAKATIIMLCDQPLVTPTLLERLIEVHSTSGKPIVASHYKDVLGVPALFHRSFFGRLIELDGDMGARKLIQQHISQADLVPFSAGAIDLDTPEDYEKFLKIRRK